MRLASFLLVALALAFPATSLAGRLFPQDAKFGKLTAGDYPYIKIGDNVFHCAPGLRIRDQWNRIILPVTLSQTSEVQTDKVLYQLDMQGDLIQLWLLTPEEADTASRASSSQQ